MQSDRGVNLKDAKALVPQFRRAAAPFPADPSVQASLAEAEYDAGNLAEAEAAADRAIAAEPGNVDALTYKAMVAMARAEADPAANAATWRPVRQRILAINKTDPDDPFPFILFFRSFAAEGAEPTANAVTGLLRAFELAPYDEGLRQTVGYRHLQDGKADAARAALAPIAYNPHGGERAAAMQAVVDALDSGGAPAALALWDRQKADEGKAGKEETKAGGRRTQGTTNSFQRARSRFHRAMRLHAGN
jgi:tetratricopeptide (TPR) repeat protein